MQYVQGKFSFIAIYNKIIYMWVMMFVFFIISATNTHLYNSSFIFFFCLDTRTNQSQPYLLRRYLKIPEPNTSNTRSSIKNLIKCLTVAKRNKWLEKGATSEIKKNIYTRGKLALIRKQTVTRRVCSASQVLVRNIHRW